MEAGHIEKVHSRWRQGRAVEKSDSALEKTNNWTIWNLIIWWIKHIPIFPNTQISDTTESWVLCSQCKCVICLGKAKEYEISGDIFSLHPGGSGALAKAGTDVTRTLTSFLGKWSMWTMVTKLAGSRQNENTGFQTQAHSLALSCFLSLVMERGWNT